MTEQPNLSKYCTKCNRFTDHWGSECPTGDMLDDWVRLDSGNAMFYEFHRDGGKCVKCGDEK